MGKMSKFNRGVKGVNRTFNEAGGSAYKYTNNKLKLVHHVLTSFFGEQKYYGDNTQDIVELIKQVAKEDPKFVANLAVYARNEFNMRSISHATVVELAQVVKGDPIVKEAIKAVVIRPDDMTEILSYQLSKYGKPIPNSMKKGLASALKKFNEYFLAKYSDKRKEVKLRDVVKLAHPKPDNKEQEELWKRLCENKLAPIVTRETVLTTKGNNAEAWTQLIEENRLPYMASIRSICSILKSGVERETIKKLLNKISNHEAVIKSKLFPFQFLNAYRMVEKLNDIDPFLKKEVLDAITQAINHSCENLPKLKGRTVFIADVSGSMSSPISRYGITTMKNISLLFTAIGGRISDDSVGIVFGTDFETHPLNSNDDVMSIYRKLDSAYVGHGTNLESPLKFLLKKQIKADRIIVLSDMQCYTMSFWNFEAKTIQSITSEYRKIVNPDVHVYSIDLAGYGTVQWLEDKNTHLLSGWSEKIFSYIPLVEEGKEKLVETIEKYQW